VREDHACLFIEVSENLIVPVALLQILVSSLVAPSDQVDAAVFGCDRSRIERHFKFHAHWSFLELLVVHFENVGILLIPLERVHTGWHTWMEAVLDIVVNSKVCLDQV
jgi:hypothetical protein